MVVLIWSLPRAVTLLLAVLVTASHGCKVLNWRHMTMAEILHKAEIVVYGKETSRFEVPDTSISGFTERTDSYFQVYCVFKLPPSIQSLPQNITIKGVQPRTSCSGTKYEINQDIILALKRSETEGYYEWDEVNVVPDGAAFPADDESKVNFAATICGLQNPKLPGSRSSSEEPSCPAKNDDTCRTTGEPGRNSSTYVGSGPHSGQNTVMLPLVVAFLCLILLALVK